MTTINVTNAAQLTSALSTAHAGDTISLAGGNYGDFSITGRNFSSDLTITSSSASSPAVFHTLDIQTSSHLHFDDIKVAATPTMSTITSSWGVEIWKSSYISLTGGVVEGGPAINGVAPTATALDSTGNVKGLPAGYGLKISLSSNVVVDHEDISQFDRGVMLNSSSNLTISNNDIHDTRRTPIFGGGLHNVTIDSNHLHDIHPWRWGQTPLGDHADFIALWTNSSTQSSPSEGIKVINNLMDQGSGVGVLGMWLQGTTSLPFTGAVIENNAFLDGNFQGINLKGVAGGTIDHNVMLQTSGDSKAAPGVLLSTNARNIHVFENIVGSVNDLSGTGANIMDHNTLVQKWSAGAAGYYSSSLVSKIAALNDGSAAYLTTSSLLGGGSAGADPGPGSVIQSGSTAQTGQVLTGTTAADHVLGTTGADTLVGGYGNDSLTGGAAADVFRFAYHSGDDVITDFGAGGAHDVLDLSGYLKASIKAALHDTSSGVTINFSTGDSITLNGVHAASLHSTGTGFVF